MTLWVDEDFQHLLAFLAEDFLTTGFVCCVMIQTAPFVLLCSMHVQVVQWRLTRGLQL